MPSLLIFLRRAAAALLVVPLAATALAAGPTRAWVGNFKDNSVSVVDLDAGRVVATVPVAAGPDGMLVSPDGARVYVSGSASRQVSVLDAAQDRALPAIEVGQGPQGLAFTPDGRQLLVAVNGDDRMAFVDLASGAVTGTAAVAKPHTIAVRPDGARAYVASQQPGAFAVVVIDLATREAVGRIALDKPPRDLEFDPDGRLLYLTLAGVPAVQLIDPQAERIVGQIDTGVSPHVATRLPGSALGAVVVQGPGEVALFDPAARKVVRHIAVGAQPHWLDATPDGQRLVVSNEGADSLSVVDLASGRSRTIAVGSAPRKVALWHGPAHASAHASAHGTPVSIANFAFAPAQITIRAGQRVTWRNDDGAPHGVAFKDGAPGAPLLLPGKGFSRRFDQPGRYDYVCSVHAYMTGQVIVE